MKKEDFSELLEAVNEMVEIKQGKRKPVSVVKIASPKKVHQNLNLKSMLCFGVAPNIARCRATVFR